MPYYIARSLKLAGLDSVLTKMTDKLSACTDGAADNRGLGKFTETMDNMFGKNSLLEALLCFRAGSGRDRSIASDVDEDLEERGLLHILRIFYNGNESQRRQLTTNLHALRMAERRLEDLRRIEKAIKAAHESAHTKAMSRTSSAAVGAVATGASSPCRACPTSASAELLGAASNSGERHETSSPAADAETLPDADNSRGETINPVASLLDCAKEAMDKAASKLAAYAAAAAAELDASPAAKSAHTKAMSRTSSAAVGAVATGASSPCPTSASAELLGAASDPVERHETSSPAADAETLPDADNSRGETSSSPNVSAGPSASFAPPMQLKMSGPLNQVPETVGDVFNRYEEEHVRPLLARQHLCDGGFGGGSGL
jgi:hypothetical protein